MFHDCRAHLRGRGHAVLLFGALAHQLFVLAERAAGFLRSDRKGVPDAEEKQENNQ